MSRMLDRTLAGKRVRLIHTNDEHTHLVPGSEGTVQWTYDDDGDLAVNWDSGSRLSLLPAYGDRWEILEDECTTEVS